MKRMIKVLVFIILITALPAAAAGIIFKYIMDSKFVPGQVLEAAPDRISGTVLADLSNPLQKQVTGGVVEGFQTKTGQVQAYLGIPYAAPPVGSLRWKAAQDVRSWDGVWETKACGPNPIQGDNVIKPGECGSETVPDPSAGYSEDCLYLNVWTNGTGKDMPVVFYIPGGAWVGGSNSVENYNGEYLASQNVVFVSVNYRLGIFGWLGADVLAEEDPNGSAGNYGFTDILKALEWVKGNIANFGGNADNVTLYGGSAGGNLTDLLMVSPQAEGLFRRAVSMSYPIDMVSPAWDREFKFSHGNRVIPDEAALEKMRRKSVRALYKQNGALAAYAFSGPVIDGYYIDMLFADAIAQGRGKDTGYMAGINYNDSFPGTGDAQFAGMIAETADERMEGDILRAVYLAMAKKRMDGGAGNTYILQFEHPAPGPGEMRGAVHGGDLPYMLQYFSGICGERWTGTDYRMGRLASAYFINFCRTGNPNGRTADGESLPEWKQSQGEPAFFAMGNGVCGMRQMDEQAWKAVTDFLKKEKGYKFFS